MLDSGRRPDGSRALLGSLGYQCAEAGEIC